MLKKHFLLHQVAVRKTLEEMDMEELLKYIKEYEENCENSIRTVDAVASEQNLESLENINEQMAQLKIDEVVEGLDVSQSTPSTDNEYTAT